jgi:ribosomal protein S27E
LNPDGFINRDDKEICSTLVHEQVHVAQHTGGTAPRRGYHNREWAAMMKAIGLQPSSTGMVGGRETGQRMSHYVIAGGPFEQTGWKLNLQSAARPGEQRKKKNKTTFTCPNCDQRAFGKPSLAILCEPCGGIKMQPEGIDLTIAEAA